MRGRLATQIRSKASSSANGGFSKERRWPNVRPADRDGNAASPTWGHGSEDTTVEMELGLPVHGGERSPLKEKVGFTFPTERP